MPSVTRLGDKNTGHDACPAVPLAGASGDVFVNGKGAGRVGDPYAAHACVDHPSHVGNISSGSSSVNIDGIPAGRIGDSVSCGGSVAEGSPNVFVGG
jgi:uncharacterized Zn-binding protein involved in type VI secretion